MKSNTVICNHNIFVYSYKYIIMCVYKIIYTFGHLPQPPYPPPCLFSSKTKDLLHLIQVAITLLRLLLITSFEGGWWLLTLDLDQSVRIIRALRCGWCHHTRVVDLSCRCRKECWNKLIGIRDGFLGFCFGTVKFEQMNLELWQVSKMWCFLVFEWESKRWFTDLRNTWREVDAVISHLRCWLLGFA